MSKEEMLEYIFLKYKYTFSEYDPFFNRYIKLSRKSIERVYEKVIKEKYKNRYDFEIDIEKILKDEKRRLSTNTTKTSK